MKRLAELLKELEHQLEVCMRCGMCQSVCPLFAETGREADVARGKLALLDGLAQEMFKNPQGVTERLGRCLLCGSCAASCPSGVRVLDVFIKARAILAGYTGLHPFKKLLFRRLLSHPALFDTVLEWCSKLQGVFFRPADAFYGTSCARVFSPFGDRHFRNLSPVPFHKLFPEVDTSGGTSGYRVAFFVGCVIDKFFPTVGEAVLQTLNHHGVDVLLPSEMGCCGMPALAAGDTVTFENLVHYNLEKLGTESFDFLVTACATCTAAIKKLWPLMAQKLPPRTREKIDVLAGKTLDISQFLVDRLDVDPPNKPLEPIKASVTYHDPCHLKKSLGIALQPRILIRSSAGYRFQEMSEADRCCGCGGSFNLQYYELSKAIGQRKRDSIAGSGCSIVATSCPACMLQISDILSQSGNRVTVKHVIEIYADSLAHG